MALASPISWLRIALRAASSSRTASRPGSQRVEMGLSFGPSDAFWPSWPLRAGTARDPIQSLMQPWIALWLCLGFFSQTLHTLTDAAAAETDLAAYAKRSFEEAQSRYQKAPGQTDTAWQFGRACFDLAEFATNKTERASVAEQGMAACQQAIARESNSAPAHYYLGMNLGQLARTRSLSALKLVDQMEEEFSRARDLDDHLDCAGPDRNLGLLYADAPSIGSIGSRTQARAHLKSAVKLAPEYPENRLNLIEAYLNWGERTGAHRELQALEAAWPTARTNLVGDAWAASWADWEPRLKKLKKKIEETPKAISAPRGKN